MPRPRTNQPTYKLVKRGGRWSIQFWEDGAAKRVSCGTKLEEEAREFLASFIAGRSAEPIPKVVTIGAILDAYALDRVPRDGEPRVHAPATLLYAVTNLGRHLAYLPVDLFGKVQARQYCQSRRTEPQRGRSAAYRKQGLANGTLNRELGILRAAFAWAVREKWLADAPHVERPPPSPARERWLTTDEAGALLDACTRDYQRLFIAIALYTAARTTAISGTDLGSR